MRIHFPNAEHADVPVDTGRMVFGAAVSGPDTVSVKGLAAQHVALEIDSIRGIWLSVLDPQAAVMVNGRPVRERAYLRLGDQVLLGRIKLLVKPDSDYREKPPLQGPADAPPQLPGRVALRAVAGQHYGKTIALQSRTVIGRGSDCDIVLDEPELARRHALIENLPEGLYLRDLGSTGGTVVNGVTVRDTVLRPGDQLAFDQTRFLIEAPGWQPVAPATPVPTPPPPGQSSTQVQRRLVPPPGSLPPAAPAPAARPAATPAEVRRSSNLGNWILALAALVTLIALGTVVYLTLNGKVP